MKTVVIAILTLIILFVIQAFRTKKVNSPSFLDLGQLLFPNNKEAFDTFYNLFLSDKKTFLSRNNELLEDYDNFDLEKLEPLEVLYIFGDSKELIYMTDWRGEENEREIEAFIDKLGTQKHTWTNTEKLRSSTDEDEQRNGKFIIELFKAVDKDLQAIDQRLIFLNLSWDAYVYTTISSKTFEEIVSKSSGKFHGVDKLKK